MPAPCGNHRKEQQESLAKKMVTIHHHLDYFAAMQIVEATRVERILEIVERSGNDFNAVNISTAFHRLAKMWHDPQV